MCRRRWEGMNKRGIPDAVNVGHIPDVRRRTQGHRRKPKPFAPPVRCSFALRGQRELEVGLGCSQKGDNGQPDGSKMTIRQADRKPYRTMRRVCFPGRLYRTSVYILVRRRVMSLCARIDHKVAYRVEPAYLALVLRGRQGQVHLRVRHALGGPR